MARARAQRAELASAALRTLVLPKRMRANIARQASLPAARLLAGLGESLIVELRLAANAAIAGEDAEPVHQLRVLMRRVRALLWIAERSAQIGVNETLLAQMRWFMERFGRARNWDVFIELHLGSYCAGLDSMQIVAWREYATGQARAKRRSVRQHLRSARFTQLCEALATEIARLPTSATGVGDTALRDRICEVLSRRHQRLNRRGKRLMRMDDIARHQLRIDAKKMRYAAEVAAALYPGKRAQRYLSCLTELQGTLGELQDLATARELATDVHQHTAPGSPAPLELADKHQRALLARRQRQAWRRYQDVDPFWS